jgi:hypothetical protein
VILGDGGILIVDPLSEGEDLVDLVDAVILLLFLLVGLAAGVGMRSVLCQVEAGLKGAADVPALLPMLKAGLHFIECTSKILVLMVDSVEVVV